MNRDRRTTQRRPYPLRVPGRSAPTRDSVAAIDRNEIAPWVIARVRAWPRTTEDRIVAVALGVQLEHVHRIRRTRQ